MKAKLSALLLALVALSSCDEPKMYEITYAIHYPGGTKTYVKKLKATGCGYTNSSRGSNYIWIDGVGQIVSTSAPVEYITCKKIGN